MRAKDKLMIELNHEALRAVYLAITSSISQVSDLVI